MVSIPATLTGPLRRRIVGEVRRAIHGSDAVPRAINPDDRTGLFAADSVVRRVHGDPVSMMIGGVAALLLQMLHPKVLAGVWDHSNFRADMRGRLHRTARFIAVTTYGAREDADAAIARVRAIHAAVAGRLPDGTPYRADDPHLLAWVHVSEAMMFLAAWQRYGRTALSPAEQEAYFAEFAAVPVALGADPVPRSRAAADAFVSTMRPDLRSDARSREVAALVLAQPAATRAAAPVQALTFQAAVDLLPDWAREMHGLRPSLAAGLVRSGGRGLATAVRWAFTQR
ncbi:oxygenase MpaB family protein [Sphingomonas sp.]|uniref:oxygenase MpaB family protein n=1 Tax=Sphingomonas sp. TaxID=28214 RepID=UPI002DD6A5D4|nr:oxygenase MpaB family protein [Sphingomonas sp.]